MAQVRRACRRVDTAPSQAGATMTGGRSAKTVSLVAKNRALYDCAGRIPQLLTVGDQHISIPIPAAPPGKRAGLYVAG
jgi:hypothetical protein